MIKELASKIIFLTLMAAFPLFLQSCAPANPSAMVPLDATIYKTHSGTVAVAVGGTWPPDVHSEDFKQALEDSLLRYRVFSRVITTGSGTDYRIEVTLLELKQPFVGFTFTIKSVAHWRLLNAKTGSVVWEQTIDRHFTAGVGDAFVAAHRAQLANEGAIRENIKAGIQEIGQLSL